MPRCANTTFLGSQCELEDAHLGKHMMTFSTGGHFYWTTESEEAVAAKWAARRSGS